jgi:hypothetical protein
MTIEQLLHEPTPGPDPRDRFTDSGHTPSKRSKPRRASSPPPLDFSLPHQFRKKAKDAGMVGGRLLGRDVLALFTLNFSGCTSQRKSTCSSAVINGGNSSIGTMRFRDFTDGRDNTELD